MRKTLIFICFPMILFGQINLKEIAVQNDCHMCPGFIIIEKGLKKDTLKMGSWGSPPKFNQFKANGGDYIAFESSLFIQIIPRRVSRLKLISKVF